MNKIMMMMLNQNSIETIDATIWKVNCEYTSYYVYVEADGYITINWGDGNIEQQQIYGGTEISHYFQSYPEGQDFFQIQITGNHMQVKFYTSGCETYIIQLISGAKTLKNYQQMCYRCNNLTYVAPTFFIYDNTEDYNVNCQEMFYNSGIETIQHNLFEFCQKACSCTNMFYMCLNLISVGSLSIPNESNTNAMFSDCMSLNSVNGQKLVEKWTTGHFGSHEYMFFNCYSLTGVFNQIYWWAQFDGGPVNWYSFSYSGIFYNCTSLSNYDEIPSDWK